MTIRGTKNRLIQEVAEMDSIVAKKLPNFKQSQNDLVSDILSATLSPTIDPRNLLHGRLAALRKKGRRDTDSSPSLGGLVPEDKKLSISTGCIEERGGHLLTLFVPPSKDDSHLQSKSLGRTNTPSIGTPFRNSRPVDTDAIVAQADGFQQDLGHSFITQLPPLKQLNIIDTDQDTPHYAQDFYSNEHFNYMGWEKGHSHQQQQHVVVSILVRRCTSSGSKAFYEFSVLIKTVEKDEAVTTFTISTKDEPINGKKALKLAKKKISKLSTYSLEEITDDRFKNSLKDFEMKQLRTQYRVGVLYCKNGQTNEDDMYSNVEHSPYFTEFLEVLGETIDLTGWTKFKGGLDVKGGATGLQSVFTQFQSYDIMFHVSTMLPFQANDVQRVERKRHLGNDVVVIVFVDSDGKQPYTRFNPSIMRSQFNQVFVVVQVDHNYTPPPGEAPSTHYRMAITYKDGVPPFGPPFPHNYSFSKDKFRNIFLTKLINAERAAVKAPVFAQKIKRTRKEALKMMYDTYLNTKSKS